MTRTLSFPLAGILFLLNGCSTKYPSQAPHPILNITPLQNTYTVNQAAYIQADVVQQGYNGAYDLSATLQEGRCTLRLAGKDVPTSGEWISMPSANEILQLTPNQTGPLRIIFTIKTADGAKSNLSSIYATVTESSLLNFSVQGPATSPVSSPAQLVLCAQKAGWMGMISIKCDQLEGAGKLQYGEVVLKPKDKFEIPANNDQTIYYIPSHRGIHKLQFIASDGETTQYKTQEIIVVQ